MPFTINLHWLGVPPAAQQDIRYACDQWQASLMDDVTLNVQVVWTNMAATDKNGLCVPGIIQPANSTLTRAQAKRLGLIAAQDPALDMVIALDSTTPWIMGTGPGIAVGAGQFSLSTTVMHELCHGLGFAAFCNIDSGMLTGTYSDAASLVPAIHAALQMMNPAVQVPAYFNLGAGNLNSGFAVITPFAGLFRYHDANLQKGVPAQDFTAFTTPNAIELGPANAPLADVLTANGAADFVPFRSCDHVAGPAGLMAASTVAQYFEEPDAQSLGILEAIGWTLA